MKKFTLLFASLIALSAHGQKFLPNDGMHDINIIPKDYSFDGNAKLHFFDYDRNVSVYDDNIEIVKQFELSNQTYSFERTYVTKTREVKNVTAEVLHSEMYIDFNDYYMTYEDWLYQQEMMGGNDYTFIKKEMPDGTIKIYGYNIWSVESTIFAYNHFGAEYPMTYLLYNPTEGTIHRFYVRYKVEYTEWKESEKETVSETYTASPMKLLYWNMALGQSEEGPSFYVSQTLFNEDEDYEYIVSKYTLVEEGGDLISDDVISGDSQYGGEIILSKRDLVSTGYPAQTGFRVMSSDGRVLKDIDFEDGFRLYDYNYDDQYLIVMGNKTYIAIDGEYNDNEGSQRGFVFYLVDGKETAIKQVKTAPIKMKVTKRANTIDVHLSNTVQPSNIVVTNMNGMTLARQNARAGQSEVMINAIAPSGVYNVSRIQNGKVVDSSKVVLK